ncbi:MucR family transcriptional regulator [Sinorhizobium alkalisoli]
MPEDGKKLKSLKRRLTAKYGLTPEQYRQKC